MEPTSPDDEAVIAQANKELRGASDKTVLKNADLRAAQVSSGIKPTVSPIPPEMTGQAEIKPLKPSTETPKTNQ